jgi:hypothetical protein
MQVIIMALTPQFHRMVNGSIGLVIMTLLLIGYRMTIGVTTMMMVMPPMMLYDYWSLVDTHFHKPNMVLIIPLRMTIDSVVNQHNM